MLHIAFLILHFTAVILGVGQIAALATLVGAPINDKTSLRRLTSFVQWSLAVVLITGIVLVAISTDHLLHKRIYIQAVGLITVVMGGVAGMAGGMLRKASDPVEPETLAKLKARYTIMAALTVCVIILISAKPG